MSTTSNTNGIGPLPDNVVEGVRVRGCVRGGEGNTRGREREESAARVS